MTGKVICDNIYGSIGRFNGFWAITRRNGLAGMINKDGKVLIENKYEEEIHILEALFVPELEERKYS